MSAHLSIRVDLADEPLIAQDHGDGPYLRVQRFTRVEGSLEHLGTAVLLEAESLEALSDWLHAAAAEVDEAIADQPDEPDTDAAAADTGALA